MAVKVLSLPKPVTPSPFIKWAGGKTGILDQIVPALPLMFDVYHEPFLGGGSLFYRLAPKRAVLSDSNRELITTYRMVRDRLPDLIRTLSYYAECHDKAFYEHQRSASTTDQLEIAARFIYLNKTCFNGLYRVNRSGKFNTPMGDYKSPKICNIEVLTRASRALQGVEIYHRSYLDSLEAAHRGDLVYFDPPYIPLSGTSDFTAYTALGFTQQDQVTLRDCADTLRARGVHVLLSNSDTPLTRCLYHNWHLVEISAPRSIGAKSRGSAKELLIIG
jgi:DNA adenine methylase